MNEYIGLAIATVLFTVLVVGLYKIVIAPKPK